MAAHQREDVVDRGAMSMVSIERYLRVLIDWRAYAFMVKNDLVRDDVLRTVAGICRWVMRIYSDKCTEYAFFAQESA